MFGERVRALRRERGWTQAQLAGLAGVSRQLVGAVEAGRHLPRVDAAVALAGALGQPVEALLAARAPEVVGVVELPLDGRPVRVAQVGERLVCHPAPPGAEGWSPADGVVRGGHVELLDTPRPAVAVAGCDPALGLAARLVERDSEWGVLAAAVSTAVAVEALGGGRVHAAVVHGPARRLPDPPCAVRRLQVARWRVGLAAPDGLARGWPADALAGRMPVVQREAGATSQRAFEEAVARAGGPLPVAGPRASGHVDAATLAGRQGCAAVSIEPVALALGMAFHPLEEHVSQLWIASEQAGVASVRRFVDELGGARLQRRLAAIGGYDLTGCGREVAV